MFVLIKNCTPTHVRRSVVTGANNHSQKGRKEAANRNRKEAKEETEPFDNEREKNPAKFATKVETEKRNETKRNETSRRVLWTFNGNGISGELGRNSDVSLSKHRISGLIGRFKRTGTTTCGWCAVTLEDPTLRNPPTALKLFTVGIRNNQVPSK